MARPTNNSNVWMENGYVLWWLGLLLGGAVMALANDFPRNFHFLPIVAAWAAAMIGLGLIIDAQTNRRFSEGALPFGTIYYLAQRPVQFVVMVGCLLLAIFFLRMNKFSYFLVEVIAIAAGWGAFSLVAYFNPRKE